MVGIVENKAAKTVAIFFLLITFSLWLHGEHVRGPVNQEIPIRVQHDFEVNLEVEMGELVVVDIEDDPRFLKGIEVELVLSEAIKRYADSLGVFVYYDIEPSPNQGMEAFTGKRAFFSVLPFVSSSVLRIPTTGSNPSSAGRPTNLMGTSKVIGPSDFPIILTVQPIMKGVPDSVLARKVFFNVRSDVAKRGVLDLKVLKPADFVQEPVSIRLDDREVQDSEFPMELDSGLHKLSLISDIFKPAMMNLILLPGQTQAIVIELEPNISTLVIESLEGATVYLDGKKVSKSRVQLSEGNHTIRFKVGEYSISKTFNVEKGKSYNVSLLFDIKLEED
jgi:hypothetical protein